MPMDEAAAIFRSCSGSELWALRMAEARPFLMLEGLYEAAGAIWFALPPEERIDAYSSLRPDVSVIELAEPARLYKEKFGFIFVVCHTGKSSNEMLAICRARLGNSVETELQIAAEEHRKIIKDRLNKLLEQ